MAEIDLSAMRERLLDLRREYQAQIHDFTSGDEQVLFSDPQHDETQSSDPADDAGQLLDAERTLSLVNHAREQLDLVEAALARMDAGSYGLCADCGQAIDPRRLAALPSARYCLADQARREQR